MRGQLAVMIVLGILYAIGLWAVGIDVGPLIGLIAGLISFVPYLGSITGILMGVIAALVQYGDVTHVVLVVTVFVIGQLIEGYVLVPRLVGEKIGLHPVAVIFAVLAGGEMFGFLGVLLALPVASVLMVLLRYANERYRASQLYAHESPETPADAPAADAPAAVREEGDLGFRQRGRGRRQDASADRRLRCGECGRKTRTVPVTAQPARSRARCDPRARRQRPVGPRRSRCDRRRPRGRTCAVRSVQSLQSGKVHFALRRIAHTHANRHRPARPRFAPVGVRAGAAQAFGRRSTP